MSFGYDRSWTSQAHFIEDTPRLIIPVARSNKNGRGQVSLEVHTVFLIYILPMKIKFKGKKRRNIFQRRLHFNPTLCWFCIVFSLFLNSEKEGLASGFSCQHSVIILYLSQEKHTWIINLMIYYDLKFPYWSGINHTGLTFRSDVKLWSFKTKKRILVFLRGVILI